MRYSFKNDYSLIAAPGLCAFLDEKSHLQLEGYGLDVYSDAARDLIANKLEHTDADVHFVSGGTQANLLVIAACLRTHESVIAVKTAHIHVHETGAIENTGHRIHEVPGVNGKITCSEIETVLQTHQNEHAVKPKMVFISNCTEVGTVYTGKELSELSAFCKENNLLLYMDGARLGTALASSQCDYDFASLKGWVDIFYIGGTKNGAMLGEAIVIVNPDLQQEFRWQMKQKGALLAKGALIGLQFLFLFENNRLEQFATQANMSAQYLAQGIETLGFELVFPCHANQVFAKLPKNIVQILQQHYGLIVWDRTNENSDIVRLVTSYQTTEEVIEDFLDFLAKSK